MCVSSFTVINDDAPMLTFRTILEALKPEARELEREARGSAVLKREVTGGIVDSRLASPGDLFVAMAGENVDGHEFIQDAFRHGAHLALTQRDPAGLPGLPPGAAAIDLRRASSLATVLESLASIEQIDPATGLCLRVDDSLAALQQIAGYWRRKLTGLRVIGITGSVGKSTTKEVTAQVLSRRYRTSRNQGNLNNEIGLPLTILGLDEFSERAVLEMGFYVSGEIALLCDIAQPHVGVITNIGTVHAERAGSQKAIASGKAELVQALPPAPLGVAVLNYDDPWVRPMAEQTQARVFYYGLSPQAHLWAEDIEGLGLEGIHFQLHYRRDVISLRAPMIGRHSVHTALRAAAVGLVEGLGWQEIVDGLRSESTQLRLVTVRSECGALILDDTYNASPESTLAALNLLEELEGHKIAVLGDMLELGPYEQEGHEMVGVRAAEVADELVTVGERGRMIAQAAWLAGLSRKMIHSFADSQEATRFLEEKLGAQDVVLVKGSHAMRMDLIVAALEKKVSQ